VLFAVIVSQGASQIYRNQKGLSMIRVFAAALILGLIVLVGLSSLVDAQQACLALPQFLDGLAEKYAETPRMSGLAGTQLLVITASEAGTWTALMVNPDGYACLVSAGEAFVAATAAIPGALN
jgi:hypothetical protein